MVTMPENRKKKGGIWRFRARAKEKVKDLWRGSDRLESSIWPYPNIE